MQAAFSKETFNLSIIIPAYNEARSLRLLIPQLTNLKGGLLMSGQRISEFPKNIEVIVACNGCTDGSAGVVKAFQKALSDDSQQDKAISVDLQLIEIDEADKIQAINRGNEAASYFPRVLIDADIDIALPDVIFCASQLIKQQKKAASPAIRFNTSYCDKWVQLYYRAARHSSYNTTGLLSNVILLSEAGFNRVDPLPAVIADDEYIRHQFSAEERLVINDVSFRFNCPKTVRSLTNVLTRVHRGNVQLSTVIGPLTSTDKQKQELRQIFRKAGFSAFMTFMLLKCYVRFRVKLDTWMKREPQWERDETTR